MRKLACAPVQNRWVSGSLHIHWLWRVLPIDNIRASKVCISAFLASGHLPEEAIECIKNYDQYFDCRQIGILDYQGAGIAWTGDSTRFWSGHSTNFGFVAFGNSLSNSEIIEKICKNIFDTFNIGFGRTVVEGT